MLLKLSDYVLLEILLKCDDIDKVCLGLTCKKLWNTVKRYAVFNVDYFDFKGIEYFKQHIYLKSLIPNMVRTLEHAHYVDFEIKEIPEQTTYLKFGDDYNGVIKPGQIPYGVQHIEFGRSFNQPLGLDIIPSSVTRLKFGYHFNQPLIPGESLPSSLKHLTLSTLFNLPLLPGAFPPSLTYLHFGLNFNQPIGAGILPESLQHLVFGFSMERPLSEVSLPHNLKHLTLGCRFSHEIGEHTLPSSLDTLELLSFRLPSLHAGSLPPNLTKLTIAGDSENNIDLSLLPNTLRHLRMTISSSEDLQGLKNLKLTNLILPRSYDNQLDTSLLPDTLEHLVAGHPSSVDFTLPPNLKSLVIDKLTESTIVPSTLTSLTILNTNDNVGVIPPSVTHLILCTKFSNINFELPKHIKHLTMNVTGLRWKDEDIISIPFSTALQLEKITINDIITPQNTTTFHLRLFESNRFVLVVSDKNLYGMFIPINDETSKLNFIKLLTPKIVSKENEKVVSENEKEKENNLND